MSSILDYIDWRGDLSFESAPLCPVDELIFSKLIYADMAAVPEDFGVGVTLRDAFARFLADGGAPNGRKGDPYPLFEKAAGSRRFGELRLCGYRTLFDEKSTVQFASAVFLLPEDKAYIAFRGTDDSFVGWREDMEFCYKEETEGQKAAAKYVKEAGEALGRTLYLGGHSKGGCFAVYAAAFSGVAPEKIASVFSGDGPGLNERLSASEAYLAIRDKIRKYIPESSIVGVLLPDGCAKTIVCSDGKGIGQHNVYTWQVRGAAFETANERSATSVFADETVQKWMASIDEEKRKAALCAVFDAIEASGYKTFAQLRKGKRISYNAILKAVTQTDPAHRKEIVRALKAMAKSSGEVFYNSAKRSFEKNGAVQKIRNLRVPVKKDQKNGTEKNGKT